jgi:hypothetical protein
MIKKISLYSKTEQLEDAYYVFLSTQGATAKFPYNIYMSFQVVWDMILYSWLCSLW